MKKFFTLINLVILISFSLSTNLSAACDVLTEGFNGGVTAPSGWTFTNIATGSTYTSAGNFGLSSPSLKLDATGDRIQTPSMAGAKSVTFWIKGQGTDATSALLVEESSDGVTWLTVANIASLPTTATTKSYNLATAPTILRFTYTKSAGNLAFDDVCVSSSVLNAELVYFKSQSDKNQNKLFWQTATEQNVSHFEIQRSANGQSSWQTIGSIKAAGNSQTTKDYQFVDEAPHSINYFRLRSVDLDGKESFSNVVSVISDKGGKVKAYPTVATDKLMVTTENSDLETYQIFNLLGQIVQTGQLNGQKELIINTLPNGTYFLRVGMEQLKFIKN
jgi:hypothetical protein